MQFLRSFKKGEKIREVTFLFKFCCELEHKFVYHPTRYASLSFIPPLAMQCENDTAYVLFLYWTRLSHCLFNNQMYM